MQYTRIFITFGVLMCARVTVAAECPVDLTPAEAKELYDGNAALIVVDVREESEFCDEAASPPGHIPGAVNYPLFAGVLEERYAELPIDGDLLVVCRSGGRSAQAAAFLCGEGYTSVHNMTGGMSSWLWETELCTVEFARGDVNSSGSVDIADAVFVLAYLFDGGDAPACVKSADPNDSGVIDVADAVYMLAYLFAGGPEPAAPFGECGPDATADDLSCEDTSACQ